MDRVMKLASQRAVVIFSISSYVVCVTPSRGSSVSLDAILGSASLTRNRSRRRDMENALIKLLGKNPPVPAVFSGGRFVGSTDHAMSLHLSRNPIPLLREAGAIWL